ncbi:MAG: hypothetical protein JSW30_05180 [Dehalococcoidia bacterium]|nr:MAG: hypothetical protein JSW30_05180 [Dehalococcoidia bacterium]
MAQRFNSGAIIKTTRLTAEFDYEAFGKRYGDKAVPLFLVDENGQLVIFTVDSPPKPKIGQKLISLVEPAKDKKK